MLQRILILASVLLLNPCEGSLSTKDFKEFVEPTCFREDELGNLLINGQENPLSQTLENFIAMAEKFEASNPNVNLQEELFFFIRNFTYDNFVYGSLEMSQWTPKDVSRDNYDTMETLWEPDKGTRDRTPVVQDPFTNDEKCSIFFMMSHSILLKAKDKTVFRSAVNNSRPGYGPSFNEATQYPQEVGVVAIRGTESAVALGKVLLGMYVGFSNDWSGSISSIADFISKKTNLSAEGKTVNPLYILTMGETIALATWPPDVGDRYKFAPNGKWVSSPVGSDLNTENVCPMTYVLGGNINSTQSYSTLRGSVDGLILGRITENLVARKRDIRLSQILRMYYSRAGISMTVDGQGQEWASFCNREGILNKLEPTIKEQVFIYQLFVGQSRNDLLQKNLDYSWNHYTETKLDIIRQANKELTDYCRLELSVDKKVEDLPLESPLDVTVVLDTNFDETIFKRQQMIVGYFAKEMKLRYFGSRLTILTDRRLPTAESVASGAVVLVPIIDETYSSACAACTVTQVPSDILSSRTATREDEVILAIDQLLQAKKNNETKFNGVKGKVVVYFNFKEQQMNSRPTADQARVDNALRDLHLRHQDVLFIALGRATELVQKYSRNDIKNVISAVDEPENVIAEKLLDKISNAPATLQYNECETGRNENSAAYEDFVSRNARQHWEMPAKYFYKSRGLSITFESTYGSIRVCHSRGTASPELQKDSCIDGTKVEIKHSNPCKSLTALSCSPFYFSVLGLNNTEEVNKDVCVDTNNENKCKTMDQIKFRVTHSGIRCSGSSALISTPICLLLGVFLLHLFSKKH